jgi:RNA-directed DNA polymerase
LNLTCYGFRPGRSCHDAIGAIFIAIRYKPKFVFDADIKGCFDNINQEALLEKLQAGPAMRNAIKAWLKAGVLEGMEFTPTETGTPQGGVISPLLANIALHGMEEAISKGYKPPMEKPLIVRYADDFVIFHSDRGELQKAIETITLWLQQMGLNLSPKKTRVTHTLIPTEGNVGFDFLGFTVRQRPVGETHTRKNTHGKPLGFKTIIRPSKEAIKRHMAETKKRIRELRSAPQWLLIKELNPIIRGWTAYYKTVVSSKVFQRCDSILWYQLLGWAKWGNPKSSGQQVGRKYWHRVENRKVFSTPKGLKLREHGMTTIQRHTKVKGNASPYDGNILYWSQRLKQHPMLNETKAKLLKKQQGKCRWCELTFRDEDVMETDHIDRNRNNNALSNKMLLHRHCHDERHAKFVKLTNTMKINKLAAAGINIK